MTCRARSALWGVAAACVVLPTESIAQRAELPRGQIIPTVTAAADSSQSYALYLPSTYVATKPWPVILAFDPSARGRTPVERYQAAAERYGYIVVGSNTSRNGRNNDIAVTAMARDVLARFSIDQRRVYTAGMSGGARVALGTALASPGIAGVIASSAGYPDATPKRTLPFVLFATAGTEDFNHLEMRRLDEALTTPHRLAIFEGGHTWLSSELATDAVEWLELQAIRSKAAPVNAVYVAANYEKRATTAAAIVDVTDRYLAWKDIVADFVGLCDVRDAQAQVDALGAEKAVVTELRRRRDEDDRETDLLLAIKALEGKLVASLDMRGDALADLRREWRNLSTTARGPVDSPERRVARRVLSLLASTITTTDKDYLKIISEYRYGRGR